jgi:hypothetical protein
MTQPGWYLNCGTWFTINILLEKKKIKLTNVLHSAENKTDMKQHVFKMQ